MIKGLIKKYNTHLNIIIDVVYFEVTDIKIIEDIIYQGYDRHKLLNIDYVIDIIEV